MKAFLKGGEGMMFPLSPKVTTVGRDSCDLNIQLPGVDYQHAVLEFMEQDECFVLQDLNSAQGTYVNDTRVQNAAVRLAPGDIIRFGYNGTPYELHIENKPPIAYSSVQSRPPWTIPVYEQPAYTLYQQQLQTTTQGLPYLSQPSGQVTSAILGPRQPGVPLPRPPLRSRPLSAGSATRRSTVDPRFQAISASNTVGSPVSRNTSDPSLPKANGPGGWMTGGVASSFSGQNISPMATQTTSISGQDILLMQEKDQKLQQLSEEVNRLRTQEYEAFRKDQFIQQLQQQVTDLQTRIQQEPSVIMGRDAELTGKLVTLEQEVSSKSNEIAQLKEQLAQLQQEPGGNAAILRHELTEKIKEANNARNELERTKKDKNITSGLVTQMQRDMSNKDSTISKLTREIEMLRKEIRDRDVQLTSLNNRITKLKDKHDSGSMRTDDRNDARERELITLRQKFKASENKISDQHDLVGSLREELDKAKQALFEEKDVHRKLQTEIDAAKSQFLDMQRTERVVRVDMEQATKRLERFRNRVIQATFSTPGVKAPETEITDDELIETMKSLMNQRTELTQKIQELKSQLRAAESGTAELLDNAAKLKDQLQQSVTRLAENGHLTESLNQETSFLQSVMADESLLWIRDMVIDLVKGENQWEEMIEGALEKCGVNVKLSNDDPSKHIETLFAKWESAISEKDRLMSQIAELDEHHRADLALQLDAQKQDLENQLTDAVERARLEGEEKLNRAIDEIRAVETEKRENEVGAERRRVEEIEAAMEQLRESLTSRQEEDLEKLEKAADAIVQIAQYQALEIELRDEIARLEQSRSEEIERLRAEKEELEKKFSMDVESYKEQNKQHAMTICVMEERIVKITKKNKDYQEEITELKKTVQELNTRKVEKPVLPPKPKIILQRPTEELAAMEHLISVLRRENLDMKKQYQDSQDVIMGLRRDLSGASARLSDITGELSETQKQEMEQKRELLQQKERDLVELRQQMAKLTKIIDKQKEEMKSLEANYSKEKELAVQYKTELKEYKQRMRSLEERLSDEKDEQRKQLDLLDQEGKITSELSAQGAQCRGERHEQVILRQREALTELRARIKQLEIVRPSLPNQDQALHQVIALKKELAEMRANQAITEDRVVQNITSLDRQIGKTRGLISSANVEADMERSAHRETMDALECSETTYLSLLRAMASCLELEEIGGLRAMAHIPRDEREKLTQERESSTELLANRIKVLQERIHRKDELLQGYERDLAKLQQAQDLAEHKTAQVDTLVSEIRTNSEESQYLRESLNRTRDRLNQEKRLNAAIKQKKTFHLENERLHLDRTPHSSRCHPEDPKLFGKKKAQKEMLRKKNYEIETLKSQLTDRERNLHMREKRIYSLETSLGTDRPIEVHE
ncbi:forkhead-associated domain-containing protein 1-like isoform X2 [Gigantopelta aegis]|uniref:forkhead-associated domain-containing protein 1-like isoform X2 n=1 Tax=Gigantopelta aegis TaxID=1735272 RepID=UPI001B88A4D1|nr:forkhead-associated domain-containing protein 1-like isoform X2 [Gigantopelta aegis]